MKPEQIKALAESSPTLARLNPHLIGHSMPKAVESFDEGMSLTDEGQLQRDACKWLLLHGATGVVWHGMHKRTTCHKGVSDFVFCWHGRYVAAEAKVGKRETTSEQDDFLLLVNRNGGLGFVFRSVEELKARLESGLP